jgi:urease accessory protein UreE
MVMNNFDAWLTTDTDSEKQQLKDEWVDEETESLLKEYKCLESVDALYESISENILIEKKEEIELAMKQKDYAKLGQIIYELNNQFWDDIYRKEAIEDYENGL